MALAALAPPASRPTDSARARARRAPSDKQRRVSRGAGSRHMQAHPSGIAAHSRAVIPRNADGQ
ncbi:hypothetical protein PC116_g20237 [Phytophthora cactorum]|uniref:Uncharacterized protein n=1 Tax=Phytophthora cactorum TaxID=29920 RepID=A0A8T1C4K4_9STRA|nr:hypothetical protein Pcac1_g7805 [Phytophthora cactorum]KAG2887105.1 hypothetical protein PC114_g18954 [Phytophthora cactorum]KAG2912576.1 hypothetical protein PC117_g18859 [Phytophthora cactorum]KAG2989615.1 hypothetical protein PC119_g19258 [Phytophthora cactorum]KAG3004480.1 hypothetical protein PC120_g18531 [Phytophthora cactorum]